MGFIDSLCRIFRPLPAADVRALEHAIAKLRSVAPPPKENTPMTEPTGLVQIQQSDLDGFAAQITAAATSIGTAFTTIGTAFTTISAYVQQLLANQATPLPTADETDLQNALASLGTDVTQLQTVQPPATS